MKKISNEKIGFAQELMNKGLTYDEIQIELKRVFDSGMSNTDLLKLKTNLNIEKPNIKELHEAFVYVNDILKEIIQIVSKTDNNLGRKIYTYLLGDRKLNKIRESSARYIANSIAQDITKNEPDLKENIESIIKSTIDLERGYLIKFKTEGKNKKELKEDFIDLKGDNNNDSM